jgi:hypothetical protein
MSAIGHYCDTRALSALPRKRTFVESIELCRSFDEWVRAMKINAMPLVEIPVNVNHVLILSNPLTSYRGARPALAKLFVASWRLVMGTVVAVVSAEFPGIIRAARIVAAL